MIVSVTVWIFVSPIEKAYAWVSLDPALNPGRLPRVDGVGPSVGGRLSSVPVSDAGGNVAVGEAAGELPELPPPAEMITATAMSTTPAAIAVEAHLWSLINLVRCRIRRRRFIQ